MSDWGGADDNEFISVKMEDIEDQSQDTSVESNESKSWNAAEIKTKVLSGEYTIGKKRGRSKIWNIFGNIETDCGVEVPGFLVCRQCFSVYKHNPSTSSNLVKHKCYINGADSTAVPKTAANNATKRIAINLFTKWVVINCRPFKIVGDAGLKEIAEFLISTGAKFGPQIDVMTCIPDPTTLARNVESIYNTKLNKIKSEISAIVDVGFGLTLAIWTDYFLKKSYLTVTIHFVKDNSICCRLLGIKALDDESNTGENVHAKVIELLSDFGCALNNKVIMVTDSDSNMVRAFQPYNHLYCISHLLENTLKKSVDAVDEISNMCKLSCKIVRYFKKLGSVSNFKTTLQNCSPTSWNTFYYEFVYIKNNWNEIIQILQEKNELHRLGELNVSHLSCVIEVLKLFEEALKKLEDEEYPTLHLVVVYIDKLLRACAIIDDDMPIIKLFKEKILLYLNTLVLEKLNIFHKIALFLFPPANKLLQFNDEEKKTIRKVTKEIMSEFSENHQLSSVTNATISEKNIDLFGPFVSQQNEANSSDRVSEELAIYENTTIHYYDEFDVFNWWDTYKSHFPLLYKTTCRVLAIPASSSASKRVFSAARTLLVEKRCADMSRNTEAVNQIMFLNHNCTL